MHKDSIINYGELSPLEQEYMKDKVKFAQAHPVEAERIHLKFKPGESSRKPRDPHSTSSRSSSSGDSSHVLDLFARSRTSPQTLPGGRDDAVTGRQMSVSPLHDIDRALAEMTIHIQEMDKMRNELIKAREREGTQQHRRASSPARVADAGPAGESLLPGDLPPKLNPQRGGQGCLNLEDQGLNPWGLNPGGIDYPTGSAGVGHALAYISNIETVCIHNRARAKWTESDERDAAMRAGGMSEEVVEISEGVVEMTTQASAYQMMWVPKRFSAKMVTSVKSTSLLPEEPTCSIRSESDPSTREARKLAGGQMLTESCLNTSRVSADMPLPTIMPVFANSPSVVARGATRGVRPEELLLQEVQGYGASLGAGEKSSAGGGKRVDADLIKVIDWHLRQV